MAHWGPSWVLWCTCNDFSSILCEGGYRAALHSRRQAERLPCWSIEGYGFKTRHEPAVQETALFQDTLGHALCWCWHIRIQLSYQEGTGDWETSQILISGTLPLAVTKCRRLRTFHNRVSEWMAIFAYFQTFLCVFLSYTFQVSVLLCSMTYSFICWRFSCPYSFL
jgi:hypothetical protein